MVPLYILFLKSQGTLPLPYTYFSAGGQSRKYKGSTPNFLAAGRYLQPYQKQGTSLDAPLRLPRCSLSRLLLVGWLLLLLTSCASHPSICYLFSLKSLPPSPSHTSFVLNPPEIGLFVPFLPRVLKSSLLLQKKRSSATLLKTIFSCWAPSTLHRRLEVVNTRETEEQYQTSLLFRQKQFRYPPDGRNVHFAAFHAQQQQRKQKKKFTIPTGLDPIAAITRRRYSPSDRAVFFTSFPFLAPGNQKPGFPPARIVLPVSRYPSLKRFRESIIRTTRSYTPPQTCKPFFLFLPLSNISEGSTRTSFDAS